MSVKFYQIFGYLFFVFTILSLAWTYSNFTKQDLLKSMFSLFLSYGFFGLSLYCSWYPNFFDEIQFRGGQVTAAAISTLLYFTAAFYATARRTKWNNENPEKRGEDSNFGIFAFYNFHKLDTIDKSVVLTLCTTAAIPMLYLLYQSGLF